MHLVQGRLAHRDMEGRTGGGTGAKGTNGPDECRNNAGR